MGIIRLLYDYVAMVISFLHTPQITVNRYQTV